MSVEREMEMFELGDSVINEGTWVSLRTLTVKVWHGTMERPALRFFLESPCLDWA